MDIKVRTEGARLTIALDGELNTPAAPRFEAAYEQNKSGMNEIVIDMENLVYITSAGLRVLLDIYQEMEETGGTLTVRGVSGDIMDVFEVTGFSSFLHIE
ncbi:MAG: STAS domain-containing protein [Clostridia bacterium]|nr:STAS domain-containing protein [Clostridia bacterium]